MNRRTPLKRGSSKLKRSRLRPVSQKQASKLREYSALRRVYLAQNPTCQICHRNPATEVHHVRKRGRNLTNAATFLAVCGGPKGCHAKIHGMPAWARENGYLV